MGTAGVRVKRGNQRIGLVREQFRENMKAGNYAGALRTGLVESFSSYSNSEIAAAITIAYEALEASNSSLVMSEGKVNGDIIARTTLDVFKQINQKQLHQKFEFSDRIRESIRKVVSSYLMVRETNE